LPAQGILVAKIAQGWPAIVQRVRAVAFVLPGRSLLNLAAHRGAPVLQGDDVRADKSSDLDALGMTRSGQAAKIRATSSGLALCRPGVRNSACALARSSSETLPRRSCKR